MDTKNNSAGVPEEAMFPFFLLIDELLQSWLDKNAAPGRRVNARLALEAKISDALAAAPTPTQQPEPRRCPSLTAGSHKFDEFGPNGEVQCEWCGEIRGAAPTAAAGQEVVAYQVRSPRTNKARFMNKSKKHLIDHWQMSGYEVRPLVYGDVASAETKPVAATADPVAHVVDGLDGMWARLVESADLPEGTPLYAAPAAPVAAKTDEQGIPTPRWSKEAEMLESWAKAGAAAVAAKTDTGIPSSARADFIERIVLSVAEQPDLTSPDDYPEHMLVTANKLRNLIECAFEAFDEDAELAGGAAPVVEVLTALPLYKLTPGDSREWMVASPDGHWYKADDVRAALTTQTNTENSNAK